MSGNFGSYESELETNILLTVRLRNPTKERKNSFTLFLVKLKRLKPR